jgi:hypothetical protein
MLKQVQKITKSHGNLINSANREGGMLFGEKMHLQGLVMSKEKMFPRDG